MLGLWRTWNHYAVADSIPALASDDLKSLAVASDDLIPVRRYPFLVAEQRGGQWHALGFLNPGDNQLRAQRRDPEIYDLVRQGRRKASPSNGMLEHLDHPAATKWVGTPR